MLLKAINLIIINLKQKSMEIEYYDGSRYFRANGLTALMLTATICLILYTRFAK